MQLSVAIPQYPYGRLLLGSALQSAYYGISWNPKTFVSDIFVFKAGIYF